MTNETSDSPTESSRRVRIAAIWVLVAMLAVPALLYAGSWVDRRSYENQVSAVVASANQVIDSTNSMLTEFDGNPAEAAKLEPALLEAADSLSALATGTAQLSPPDYARQYNDDLAKLYADEAQLYRDLAEVFAFIRQRAEALSGVAKAIDGFSAGITEAKKERDVLGEADRLRSAVTSSLAVVKSLPSPEILTFSTDQLEGLLTRLKSAASGLGTAIRKRDAARAVASIRAMQEVFTSDWEAALVQQNRGGLDAYAARLADLEERRRALSQGIPARQ